jgi:FAD/FMN-containing dehydrogenase
MPDRYPNAIVDARDVADVEKAVKFASSKGWTVTAKSSGHSVLGSSIRDGAVAIDLSAMNSIEVDPVTKKARVGPGVKSDQLAAALISHGLGFPVGHCRSVAMGGFLLGGGLGMNWHQWGPACYSVTALDLVGADGVVRRIDDKSDGDLMWLARGCGPSFPGVVTAYYVDVKPAPTDIRISTYVFPLDDLPEVTSWLDELSPALPDSVDLFAFLAGPIFPDARPDARFILAGAIAYESDASAAELALKPLQGTPKTPLVADHASPRQLMDIFGFIDTFIPPNGTRLQSDSIWTDEGMHSTLSALQQHMQSSPTRGSHVMCAKPPRIPLQDNACFSMMRTHWITIYGVGNSAATDKANAEWIAEGIAKLEPITAGYWINETDLTAGADRARRGYAPEAWRRARQVRSKYDPDGLFADYLRCDS